MISLLYLYDRDGRATHPAHIADDLMLPRLLEADTVDFLLVTLKPDERLARQQLFRLLELPEFIAAVKRLDETLSAYSQSVAAFKNAANSIEGLLCFLGRCKIHLELHSRILDLCTLAERLAAEHKLDLPETVTAVKSELMSEAATENELGQMAAECDGIAGILSNTGVELTERGLSLTNIIDENLTERLCLVCETDTYKPRVVSHELRMPAELSVALAELHHDDLRPLVALRGEWEFRLDDSPLSLKGELSFCFDIVRLIERGRAAGFPTVYPELCEDKRFYAEDACDFSLLVKGCEVVPNDIDFDAASGSDVCFLTGANGGGKTAYLRCAAGNLLLALGGAPIFARRASVYRFDRVVTHFPADEEFTNSGRLMEELARVNSILAGLTADSFVFMNETYSGADDRKGAELTLETADKLKTLGCFSLWVTHFHEVVMAGYCCLTTLMGEDTAKRTFKIVRQKPDLSSYARDILKKYNLDAQSLEEKLKAEGLVT